MLPEKLLQLLNEHDVDYIVIGAVAGAAHGHIRSTKDIDIFIRATSANAKKVRNVLEEFGYDVTDLTIEEMLKRKILFRGYWLEVDIHPSVTGIHSFDKAWKEKLLAEYKGTPTYFASLNDLIKMKKAAGRPKDKLDLEVLMEIKRQLKQKGKKKVSTEKKHRRKV